MTLVGTININKRLRRHPVWQRPDYGWAWVDMLLLANDAPRTAIVNGEPIPLERGQFAWSLRTLEKEWGKSGEWINHFLEFCKDHEMVNVDSNRRRTIITIINYSAYNPFAVTETDSETATDAVTETGTTTEQKKRIREGEEKKGEAHPAEIPDDETIRKFCSEWTGDMARGIPAGIPEVWWSGWVANRLNDEKKWPRDWQRALVLAFRADFLNRHPKALVQLPGSSSATAPLQANLSPNVVAIQSQQKIRDLTEQITALEEELHQDRISNLPRQPVKSAELKKLRAELCGLERQAA